MNTNLLTQYNYNRNKAVLATPASYHSFKTKVEAAMKSDGLDGNTIVLTPDKPYDSVAVINFTGFTVNNCSDFEADWYGLCSLQGFCDDLTAAVNDEAVTSVVVNFDSGGGYTMYGDETCELVQSLSDIKPVYAYTSGLMCSMAYKVASNCSQIVASPTSLVGSIGVYCEYFDYTAALDKQGIKVTTFQGGDQKTIGSPYVALTKEQAAMIQQDIDNEYAAFKGLVVANRGAVDVKFMQGQPFTGKEAMTLGTNLVDANVNSLGQFVQLISQSNN